MNKSTPIAKSQSKPDAFTATGPAIRIRPTRISKALATRVNQEAHIGGGLTNSQKAPR